MITSIRNPEYSINTGFSTLKLGVYSETSSCISIEAEL